MCIRDRNRIKDYGDSKWINWLEEWPKVRHTKIRHGCALCEVKIKQKLEKDLPKKSNVLYLIIYLYMYLCNIEFHLYTLS